MRVFNAKQKGRIGKITAIEFPVDKEGNEKGPIVSYKSESTGKVLRNRPSILREYKEGGVGLPNTK